jgi:divalent metal cation (Fe/Co/Zn/Cd) transporter
LQAEIAEALQALVKPIGAIRDVHDIRVRQTPRGLVVNFHCRADTGLSVDAVHRAVDELERALLERRPDLQRAIGHAEPAIGKE